MTAELAIIIPTLNERDNIEPLIDAMNDALEGISWEAIFVDDDSTDGTHQRLREIGLTDPRIRCLHRIGRRGLSSACLEGMEATNAPYLAVMDADMQHDERILPNMLKELKNNNKDLVVGSRYMKGGSTGEWSKKRILVSKVATRLGQLVLRAPITDPMSGFFMLTRETLTRASHRISGKGFKILLDIVASIDGNIDFAEVPYTFRNRQHGETKLDTMVIWEYLLLLYDKVFGQYIPARFLMFVSVGALGTIVHLVVLGLLFKTMELAFYISQAGAAFMAMTFNYAINNIFTYRDQKLAGLKYLKGLAGFWVVCSIGALVSVLVANFLFNNNLPWWLSGFLGTVVGAVWNYALSSSFIWKKSTRK